MRQARWSVPGVENADDGDEQEFAYGALRALTVDGRSLLVGVFCSDEGWQRVELRDAETGDVLDVDGLGDKEWWHEPDDHVSTIAWQGDTYVLRLEGRPRGCSLTRVTGDGLHTVASLSPAWGAEDDWMDTVAGTFRAGRLAVVTHGSTHDSPHVMVRDLKGALLESWTAPEEWRVRRLITAGESTYAWLGFRPRLDTVLAERTRDRWLWHLDSNTAVGPPRRLPGQEHGFWAVAGRPAALLAVGGQTGRQVWDLARWEPVGPQLDAHDLANPTVGTLYGRPVLAGTTGTALSVWDLPTARKLGRRFEVCEHPIAVAMQPPGRIWAVTRGGFVHKFDVAPTAIHPSALRNAPP